MGRPKKSEPRDWQLNVSLTAQEYESIVRRAQNVGMRPVHFGRDLLLDQNRKLSVSPQSSDNNLQKMIYSQLARMGNNLNQLMRHLQAAYREWANKISAWLYGTSHIKIRYGIQYDEVEIEQLSPGTRGIVLLLLYLSIDRDDDRPLIIDQPEENLDPKSVFDELVNRFRDAKMRRQIVIVTHNANLVVNADADQIIVAKAGHHKKGSLPDISYLSGGLENPEIRKEVCEILEGGEAAFVERAKRLRIMI
jgi:hypothetical protein